MSNETEEKVEASKAAPAKSSDSVVKESNAGKPALVEEQKAHSDYLKAGGKSGITDEFGKPILFDGDHAALAELVSKHSAEKQTAAHADTTKNRAILTEHTVNSITKALQDSQKAIDQSVGAATEIGKVLKESGEALAKEVERALGIGPEIKMDPLKVRAALPYAGEGIKREIDPGQVTAKPGETLEHIAKSHLPRGASAETIRAYEKEIAIVNGLNPARPGHLDGKELNLPGNTKDGELVIIDSNGRINIRSKNGAESTVDADGRSYSRKPDGAGGYTEKHLGPRQEDSFELTRTGDGRLLIADKPGDKAREVPPASEDVKTERHKLLDLAEQKIADPEKRAKFEADMLRFEERAAKQSPPLSPEEIVKTYKETERLLNATGDTPLKPEDRLKIAEQAMSQCATPKSIDQGQHNTCNMTTAECVTYTRHPSDAMKLVTDVATTGEYTAPDGTHVKVNPVAADNEAKNNPPVDGDRSQASQIFQVTAVNLFYQKQPFTYTDATGTSKVVPAGQLEYAQVPSQAGALPPVQGGERLIDHSTSPPTVLMKDWTKGVPMDSPEVADRAMVDVPNIITGANDAIMIEHNTGISGDATGVKTFKSEDEMKSFIKDAKDHGKLPIIMGVHTGQEPFLHDSGGGAAGGSGGWHVVTITDYDEASGKVRIDNQWGTSADHQGDKAVHLHDLYRASRNPELTEKEPSFIPWRQPKDVNVTIRDMQKDVDWDKAHNTVDGSKEFELLRLKHQFGGMKSPEFDKELATTIDDNAARWAKQKADGTFNQAEYDNAQTKLKDIIASLPPERQLAFESQMHTKGMIDDNTYKAYLSTASNRFFNSAHNDVKAEDFMNKLKTATDDLPQAQRDQFYKDLNDNASAQNRLEMGQFERKAGAINDAQYDKLIADSTKEFLSTARTAAESATYTTRLWTIVAALPEARRVEVLRQISGSAAASPARP